MTVHLPTQFLIFPSVFMTSYGCFQGKNENKKYLLVTTLQNQVRLAAAQNTRVAM